MAEEENCGCGSKNEKATVEVQCQTDENVRQRRVNEIINDDREVPKKTIGKEEDSDKLLKMRASLGPEFEQLLSGLSEKESNEF